MADAFEIRQRMVARISELTETNASLLSTIKELMEALEPMAREGQKMTPPDETVWPDNTRPYWDIMDADDPAFTLGDLRRASEALSRARSLMEQKP